MSGFEPLMCPHCHVPMNVHAEKPVDPRTAEEDRGVGAGVGPVEVIYTCPRCGRVESRRVAG